MFMRDEVLVKQASLLKLLTYTARVVDWSRRRSLATKVSVAPAAISNTGAQSRTSLNHVATLPQPSPRLEHFGYHEFFRETATL